MPAKIARRPLRILRSDSLDVALNPFPGAGSTIDSVGAPCFGWQVLTLFSRHTQACTIQVFQRLRANSTFQVTDTWVYAGAGVLRAVVQLTGEHVRVLFTNGGVAQSPELICAMDS